MIAAPAEIALAPILVAATAELDACCDRSIVPVLPAARRDLAALMTERLVAVVARVLVHEQQALDATGGGVLDPGVESWRDRFARYPGLAALVADTARDTCAHVDELLARLAADRAAISDALFGGRPLGALAGFRGDAGDAHDGGRAVALLRFDDGRGVVYKPKDLRIAGAVLELCALLSDGLPLDLHTRGMVIRGGHAWEERIEPAACRTPDEVARFYTRIGLMLGLFELLEARDCWLDNLVATGEYPAFIDLEMVVQPRRRRPAGELTAERAADDRLSDSVVPLGVLAMPTLIAPGIAAEQIGALTPARAYLSPFRCIPALEAMTGARRASRDGYALWNHDGHAPTLRGEPVRADHHVDALLDGYRAMRRAIAARRDELLAPGGPIDRLAGLPVRVIERNTWSCYRIAQASLAPRLLAEPGRRDAWLAGLLDDAPTDDDRAVAGHEIAALRRLDVPYFVCRSDGEDLLAPDGSVVVRGWFEGSALDRVRCRITATAEAAARPIAADEDLVRSTLATGLGEPFALPGGAIDAAPGESLEPVSWLAEATAIGDAILGAAIRGDGELTWIGLTVEPFHALCRIDVLGPDLLTGTAGIAVVLADLWAATGFARFRDAALGAIAAARRSHRDQPLAGAPPAIGAFVGAGARIYALARCATALDEPALAAGAAELAAASAAAIPARSTLDVATGAAGLLLASHAAGAEPTRVAAWLDDRLGDPEAQRSPYPPELRALDSLPDLAGGLALARARLPHIRHPARETAPAALQLRVRLVLAGGGAGLAAEVHQVLDHSADPLDALDLAITAAHALGDPALAARAAAIGRLIVVRRHARGRWFPDRLVADHHDLSAVTGLAALAHALLGLHAPSSAPSIRLLAMP